MPSSLSGYIKTHPKVVHNYSSVKKSILQLSGLLKLVITIEKPAYTNNEINSEKNHKTYTLF